jgi:hypothetical protein
MIVAVVIIAWSIYQEKKPVKAAANLEFRMVTGQKDGNFQVIMFETPDRYFVLDEAFKEVFEQNDAEIISRQEQVKLLSAYKKLQYRAGLSTGEQETKTQVRMSRELFNSLRFNTVFTTEIHSKVRDSLLSIAPLE